MYRRRVRAAVSIAAAFICGVCLSDGPSQAGDGGADSNDEARFLQFSGRDIWRNGAFMHGGFLYAPGGFNQDGFMFKLMLNGGVYRYATFNRHTEHIIGAEFAMTMMAGFRIKRGDAEMKFFFGPELQRHKLWPDDPASTLRGQNLGLRMAGELWFEPTRDILIAGDASLSSFASSQSLRLALGWRIAEELFTDGFYAGPETQYHRSDSYSQRRIGLHITSMKTEDTEWSASIGYARDTDGRSSPYVRLGLSQKIID